MKRAGRIETVRSLLGRRSLVLVGMMGCGKSAIGKLLASDLGLPYFDSDAEIVAAADMPVADIFEKFGEDYFRKGEERVVARLLAEGSSVLSLGGGAFISEATRSEIAQNAISIWLKADLDLLMARVMRRPGTRPLLQTENPRATLAALMEKRSPIYSLADVHVESSRLSKRQTGDDVMRALATFLKTHRDEEKIANDQ
ncbi:MAG: shikimate kinase [Rhizobiaceae bacterium]